ncbi:MAG: hypothetical protein AM326_08945 [Candidatus Thorarchaeota archaeon SMTZ-45]|nr:MAG: hypothetical protein AM325_07755 [Candidatus Thorarchaeota archaeon SMTZ1-45]KXH75522.1 MAG: hypothetical protein AM326_08945 [Candidatus Thorarchaeota archaeon SMTZ-45]
MLELLLYFTAYFLAGLSLKLGDDLLDELDRSQLAMIPLSIAGLLFGLLMTISEWDLVLLTSIVIGVLVSGKVNNPQFIVGFVLIFGTLLVVGVPVVTDWLEWMTLLIILFMAAVLDEKGNDWADKEKSPLAFKMFEYRFVLKIVVLGLVIPWPMFLLAAIGLWIFDLGYESAGWLIKGLSSKSLVSKTTTDI